MMSRQPVYPHRPNQLATSSPRTSFFPGYRLLVFASGRERTASQWRGLLNDAGFEFIRATPLAGITGLVEAVVA
jgi:hypothetical protein